jgi:catechol 2,3-dioxygenase-like lactoylglutathione lyase family enzyme
MDVLFVASVSVITAEPAASRSLFVDALGLPLERMGGEYFASEHIPGSKHFGVWPLTEAATACFGTPEWPADRPVPQVSIEFELRDGDAVADGAAELERAGFPLLHGARVEPWGQTVARLQTPEGLIVGLSYDPSMH